MQQDLGAFRKVYQKYHLDEKNLTDNPMELFRDWFLAANEDETVDEANAMTVSTIGLDGFPKSRVVLLKQFTAEGFIFYTNYNSEKGKAILANPHICISFFWPGMERQIIIKGVAEKIAENLSDGYFESRPRGSQLSAWVSNQSEVVKTRTELEQKLTELEQKFEEKEIPRPKYWGGLLVRPQSLEFWQGRPNRLHDRIRYSLNSDYDWIRERLAP